MHSNNNNNNNTVDAVDAVDAVRQYLLALRASNSMSADDARRRLANLNSEEPHDDPLVELDRCQQRNDLQIAVNLADKWTEIENGFVEHARQYGRDRQIEYAAWRQMGVPSSILRRAGITRSVRAVKRRSPGTSLQARVPSDKQLAQALVDSFANGGVENVMCEWNVARATAYTAHRAARRALGLPIEQRKRPADAR